VRENGKERAEEDMESRWEVWEGEGRKNKMWEVGGRCGKEEEDLGRSRKV
jgi:hypothetical protein